MTTIACLIADATFSDIINYSPSDGGKSFVAVGGTTILVKNKRVINNSSDSGKAGEFCFGVDSDVNYLYYSTDTNTWARLRMESW